MHLRKLLHHSAAPATPYYDTTTVYDTIPIWKKECTGGKGRDGGGERVERFSIIYLFIYFQKAVWRMSVVVCCEGSPPPKKKNRQVYIIIIICFYFFFNNKFLFPSLPPLPPSLPTTTLVTIMLCHKGSGLASSSCYSSKVCLQSIS